MIVIEPSGCGNPLIHGGPLRVLWRPPPSPGIPLVCTSLNGNASSLWLLTALLSTLAVYLLLELLVSTVLLAHLHLAHRDLPRLCLAHSGHTDHSSPVPSLPWGRRCEFKPIPIAPQAQVDQASSFLCLQLQSHKEWLQVVLFQPLSPDLRTPWGGEAGHNDDSLQRNHSHRLESIPT